MAPLGKYSYLHTAAWSRMEYMLSSRNSGQYDGQETQSGNGGQAVDGSI